MKILLKITLFIFIIINFMGCDKTEIDSKEDFKIEFGSECGWCGGQEFITVTSSKIEYYRNIPCGEGQATKHTSRKILSSEWKEINSSFNYTQFKTLEYNECNVCADGCDEIIRITEPENTHEIRYSFNDDVEGMQDLQQILNELMEEMRKLN